MRSKTFRRSLGSSNHFPNRPRRKDTARVSDRAECKLASPRGHFSFYEPGRLPNIELLGCAIKIGGGWYATDRDHIKRAKIAVSPKAFRAVGMHGGVVRPRSFNSRAVRNTFFRMKRNGLQLKCNKKRQEVQLHTQKNYHADGS